MLFSIGYKKNNNKQGSQFNFVLYILIPMFLKNLVKWMAEVKNNVLCILYFTFAKQKRLWGHTVSPF